MASFSRLFSPAIRFLEAGAIALGLFMAVRFKKVWEKVGEVKTDLCI